jgi:hypothetical protein
VRDDENIRIRKVALQCGHVVIKFGMADKTVYDEVVPDVVDKIE